MESSFAAIGWVLGLVAVAIAAWLLWAGEDAPPPPPAGIELVYRMHLQAARDDGRITGDESDEIAVAQTTAAIGARVRALGLEGVDVRSERGEYVVVVLPDDAREMLDDVMAVIGDRGHPVPDLGMSVEFRLVIEPFEEARRVAGTVTNSPVRLWPEDADAFRAYKDAEVLRWQQALSDGVPYEPSRPNMRIAKRRGTEGAMSWDFVVVTDPDSSLEQLFGGPILERGRLKSDPRARKSIAAFDIKPAFRGAFHAFTQAHRGLRLAILVDDEVASMPAIVRPVDRTLTLMLPWFPAERESPLIDTVNQGLAGGPLRVLCGFVEERKRAD